MATYIILTVARALVVSALVFASLVALTHWAVRSRRINPFSALPRLIRHGSDPILLPLERRVSRAGGNPQDAPFWLLGIVVIGGLIFLSLLEWLISTIYRLIHVVEMGPRGILSFTVDALFTLLMGALIVRVIASWFGIGRYRRWMRPVYALTDWLVEPIRRILPPLGFVDLSPMVAWLALWVVRGFLMSVI